MAESVLFCMKIMCTEVGNRLVSRYDCYAIGIMNLYVWVCGYEVGIPVCVKMTEKHIQGS